MENLKTTFCSYAFFDGDDNILNELIPKLEPLLQAKKDISQQSIFRKFYDEFIYQDIKDHYPNIVGLFEDMIKTESIRKNRLTYLLTHWLYYQAFNAKLDITQAGAMTFMKLIFEKRQQFEKTIDQIITHFKFKQDESTKLKQNIKSSPIYDEFVKYFTPSSQLNPDKIEQKHKELLYIIEKMPSIGQSIEYQLQKHIIVSFEKAYGKQSDERVKVQKNLIQMEQLFKKIKEQNRSTGRIRAKFDELKMTKDQKNRFNILEGIKSQLTILDVYLLNYLIIQAKKNSQQDGKKVAKNIVLFVGPSGSGKTTIILRLLGYKLIQTQIQQLLTLQPVDLLPQHSSALRTSPESTSTTRYMFTSRIPQQSFNPASFEQLDACDSPGFGDSAGCEVDISNSISIQNFLMGCASVKLVVVISQRKVGDKMEGVREIASIVSNLVTDYSEIEQKVSIILNKFEDQNEFNRMKPGIQSILKNLTPAQQADTEYVSFLKSLFKRLKEKDTPKITRFNPWNTDIPDLVEEFKVKRINNPSKVFRYSLSPKSKQNITIRKSLLLNLIKGQIGRNNHLALYYISQLCLFNQCLDQQPEFMKEIMSIKDFIRGQADEKFKSFQRKIDGQLLVNDSNNNTFKELNNIKEEIKSYQIYAQFVGKLVTTTDLQNKVQEVKLKMIEDINQLSFDDKEIQQTKKKVVSTIKFFAKFQAKLQKSVIQKLMESYKGYRNQLNETLNDKKYNGIKNQTSILQNLLQVIQKCELSMQIDPNNPEKKLLVDKKDLIQIILDIRKSFQGLVYQSTNFIQQFKQSKNSFEIKSQIIAIINNNIGILRQLQVEGRILNEVQPRSYKQKIIKAICTFGKELVDQLNKKLDFKNKEADQSNIQYVRHNKFNTKKLKQIKEVYGEIGTQIDKLWSNMQRFIFIQTKKLNDFLGDLKNQKSVNRKTLKEYKHKIDRLINFSQGDDKLVESINQLKMEIKKSIGEHVKNLKAKIDKVRMTLRLRRTLDPLQLKKIFEYFKQAEAFYKTKYFSQQKCWATNESATTTIILEGDSEKISQSKQTAVLRKSFSHRNIEDDDDDDDQYENINISKSIQEMYNSIINKLLIPFNEINLQSKKAKLKGFKNITSNYLQMSNDFIQYKSTFFETQIHLNRELSTQMTKIETQEENFKLNMGQIIKDLKKYFDQIYQGIQNNQTQKSNQLYELDIIKIKQFKKCCDILITLRKYTYLDELFLQQQLDSRQYCIKIVQILQKSSEKINIQLANKKQTKMEYIKALNVLKKPVEELIKFDQLQLQQNQSCKQFGFMVIYEKITRQIAEIEGKQSNAIANLFKDETIMLPEIQQMYKHLSKDSMKNEDNLALLYNGLQVYGQKLMKNVLIAKQQYKGDQTMSLDNPSAINYINKFEKIHKYYDDVKLIMDKPQFYANFRVNQQYLLSEIDDFKFQEKLKFTYEFVKDKIQAFEYKLRPRDFQKIYGLMKKAQYIVQKLTKNSLYSQLYKKTQAQENKVTFECNKFSERLKHFMNKSQDQVKGVFMNENFQQELLQKSNFIQMYNKLPQTQKNIIDTKIQTIALERIKLFENSYEKTEEQKKDSEDSIHKMLDKFPQKLRKIFRDKFEETKGRLRQKQQDELRMIKKQIGSAQKNVFQSVIKFQQCKNINVQKQLKDIIGSQLKNLVKQILVTGSNKKIMVKQSFKRYLRHFGSQNSEQIKKTKENSKLKIFFLSEQKTLLTNLIAEYKQMIRQIEGQIVKCSLEVLQPYSRLCLQLNQIYALDLEDDYQGMCTQQRQQILTLWQQYIQKIIEKIKQIATAPEINIYSYPAIKLQKNLIELQFIRRFIDCFLAQSKKIRKSDGKKYEFLQKTIQHFQSIDIDRIIIENLKKQVDQRLGLISKVEFYDDQIKILNFVDLQTQFEKKLINSLKILQEYQQLYNKYLCQREQDNYSKIQIIKNIQGKWEENIKVSKNEFESAINDPQEQISQRIRILHKLTQIVTVKRWKIIDKQLTSREHLQLFLQTKFGQINQYFSNDLATALEIIGKKQKAIYQYSQQKLLLQNQIDEVYKGYNLKQQQLQKKIQETVDKDAKEKLTLEKQNIQSLKNQSIQKIKNNIYQKHIKETTKIEEQLKFFIKNHVISHIIIMKKAIHSVNWKSKENQSKLTQFLQKINKLSKNVNSFIFNELRSSKNNYALIIAVESDIFKSQAALQFKNKTSKQDIKYILQNCPQLKSQSKSKNTKDIQTFYCIYQKEYNQIINKFKQNPDKEQINIVAKQLKDQKDKNQKSQNDEIHSAVTIARVFAIWSMTKVDLSDIQNIFIDFQPHPAQIVAISLLIGFGEKNIKNTLIEVLTGQGKSIVLAGLCIYLALKGYRPYCACYSEYLSSRDQQEFKELFDLLGVSSKIKYGTFNQHCEEMINESSTSISAGRENNKTFRQNMKLAITNSGSGRVQRFSDLISKMFDQNIHKKSKKILIIDEADVFFNENFFGRLYCPSLSLDDIQTKQLIQYIWNITKESRQNDKIQKIQKEVIYQSAQFKRVAKKYPSIEQLIKNQVIGMLQAVYNYNHQYIIHQDSIKYRDNDSITDKISYGYKTVFVNCLEYQRKAISQVSYSSALKITLNIAPFSYSQLPRFFQSILGVSGTVSSMSDYKRQMLREKYCIEETYEIPSIYGSTQRTNDNFTIVKDEQFYQRIVEHTKKISGTSRPVALFFKTIKDVTNFYKSSYFKQFTKNTTILTQETDHESRDIIIKRVGQCGKVTILTESFARGTDFQIFDKNINDIGGLHVIQTFISSDLSEYLQTRGRTARQGNKGSFQVLINQTQLDKFEIICSNNNQFQKKMKSAWMKIDQTKCAQLRQRVQKSGEKHTQTQALFKKKPSQKEIIQFISLHNKFQEIKKNHVRTLIGIDGTASMGAALRKTISILEDSFVRTKAVLEKKKVSGSFENQIGIYRNYNCNFEHLFEYSGFESDSLKLRQFLQKIQPDGGWGNQAMQVLFQHANTLKKLDQIIIIADAKANTFAQTKQKRRQKFQYRWKMNGFPLANQAEQVLKLKQKKVKIHTLYINLETSDQKKKAQLKQYCNSISQITGGTSEEFKIKENNAAQFLTGFLVKNILMQIGGEQKGRELVESYNTDFVALRL